MFVSRDTVRLPYLHHVVVPAILTDPWIYNLVCSSSLSLSSSSSPLLIGSHHLPSTLIDAHHLPSTPINPHHLSSNLIISRQLTPSLAGILLGPHRPPSVPLVLLHQLPSTKADVHPPPRCSTAHTILTHHSWSSPFITRTSDSIHGRHPYLRLVLSQHSSGSCMAEAIHSPSLLCCGSSLNR